MHTCQLVSRETPETMRRMPGGLRDRGALREWERKGESRSACVHLYPVSIPMISIAFVDIAAGSALFCEFNDDTEFNISTGIKMSMVHSRNAHERLSVQVVDRIFGILWDTSDKTTHTKMGKFFLPSRFQTLQIQSLTKVY